MKRSRQARASDVNLQGVRPDGTTSNALNWSTALAAGLVRHARQVGAIRNVRDGGGDIRAKYNFLIWELFPTTVS